MKPSNLYEKIDYFLILRYVTFIATLKKEMFYLTKKVSCWYRSSLTKCWSHKLSDLGMTMILAKNSGCQNDTVTENDEKSHKFDKIINIRAVNQKLRYIQNSKFLQYLTITCQRLWEYVCTFFCIYCQHGLRNNGYSRNLNFLVFTAKL